MKAYTENTFQTFNALLAQEWQRSKERASPLGLIFIETTDGNSISHLQEIIAWTFSEIADLLVAPSETGERFALLLPSICRAGGCSIAARVMELLEDLGATAAVGLGTLRAVNYDDEVCLIEAAEAALEAAGSTGYEDFGYSVDPDDPLC
jgi:hypothetical protein